MRLITPCFICSENKNHRERCVAQHNCSSAQIRVRSWMVATCGVELPLFNRLDLPSRLLVDWMGTSINPMSLFRWVNYWNYYTFQGFNYCQAGISSWWAKFGTVCIILLFVVGRTLKYKNIPKIIERKKICFLLLVTNYCFWYRMQMRWYIGVNPVIILVSDAQRLLSHVRSSESMWQQHFDSPRQTRGRVTAFYL